MAAPEQDRAQMASQADYSAGVSFRREDLARAAYLISLAADLDPSRAGLWAARQTQISQRAGREPLAVQTATWLAAAGLTPDDPGRARIADWNSRASLQQSARRDERP